MLANAQTDAPYYALRRCARRSDIPQACGIEDVDHSQPVKDAFLHWSSVFWDSCDGRGWAGDFLIPSCSPPPYVRSPNSWSHTASQYQSRPQPQTEDIGSQEGCHSDSFCGFPRSEVPMGTRHNSPPCPGPEPKLNLGYSPNDVSNIAVMTAARQSALAFIQPLAQRHEGSFAWRLWIWW